MLVELADRRNLVAIDMRGEYMMIRKAVSGDVDAVFEIYERIHTEEETGRTTTGWKRGIYPTRQTALDAFAQGCLYILEEDGAVLAAARLDQNQLPAYADVDWAFAASDKEVLVLHTLVVDPAAKGMGRGRAFMRFYEDTAKASGYKCLRIDTNEKNLRARKLYHTLGYRESGIIPCTFNGLEGVQLVCLEKKLESE